MPTSRTSFHTGKVGVHRLPKDGGCGGAQMYGTDVGWRVPYSEGYKVDCVVEVETERTGGRRRTGGGSGG